MKIFEMFRGADSSGVSGTGCVLKGCIFDNGKVVVAWNSKLNVPSLGIYDNYYEFYLPHVKMHPSNKTEIKFIEELIPAAKRNPNTKCRHCKHPYKEHPVDKQNESDGYVRSCSGNLIELEDDIRTDTTN